METEAKVNGYYSLPSVYTDAENLAHHGNWDWVNLRMTPYALMQRVRFVWHLDYLCKEKENADMERARREAERS